MKNPSSNVIVAHDFHPETLDQLDTLRDVRLGLAKKQLENIDATLEQLLSRGLIQADDKAAVRIELKKELLERIQTLEMRSEAVSPNDVYFDELSLYVDLI